MFLLLVSFFSTDVTTIAYDEKQKSANCEDCEHEVNDLENLKT